MPALNKLLLFIIITSIALESKSEQYNSDTIIFKALNKTTLQFFLDDTYFFGGYTSSGIYYSNHFKDLSYGSGLVYGIEQYFPLSGKVFFSAGLHLTHRNFSQFKNTTTIRVNNLFLDIPTTTAFELPVLRKFDFRLLLGSNISIRTRTTITGNYDIISQNNPNVFKYNTNNFSRFDFGWLFGLSAEYRDFLFRMRSFSGFIKLDSKDQGMLNSFNFEVGYFLFRNLNNKK